VSFREAMTFCRRLSALEHASGRLPGDWHYTLPTEAQWEYACRAGSVTAFSFGDDSRRLSNFGWFGGMAGEGGPGNIRHPQKVGTKLPNAWGLHDMHGNVWEWCRDHYVDNSAAIHQAPTDPTVLPASPGSGVISPIQSPRTQIPGNRDGGFRVLRGGGWYGDAADCRSARRLRYLAADGFNPSGFRLVLERSTSAGDGTTSALSEKLPRP